MFRVHDIFIRVAPDDHKLYEEYLFSHCLQLSLSLAAKVKSCFKPCIHMCVCVYIYIYIYVFLEKNILKPSAHPPWCISGPSRRKKRKMPSSFFFFKLSTISISCFSNSVFQKFCLLP